MEPNSFLELVIKMLGKYILLATVGFLTSAPASATMFFGHKEELHRIVDVGLKGKGGEKLFLAYKTDTYFFVAGVSVIDQGYFLGIDDKPDSYYPMPTGNSLAEYQAKGLLPNPLPQYSLSIGDRLVGYSLWIMLLWVTVNHLTLTYPWRSSTTAPHDGSIFSLKDEPKGE